MPKNKYHAVRTTCNQEHLHASKTEAAYCDYLHILMQEKADWRGSPIAHIDHQPVVDLPGGIRYKPDFLVWPLGEDYEPEDTMPVFVEVKGKITAQFSDRRKLMDKCHPARLYVVGGRQSRGRWTWTEK